jgi:hypothetical protein
VGRSAHAVPEVELLPPDREAFAIASADGFVEADDTTEPAFDDVEVPRSPWVTLGAAGAVAALLAVAVVVSAPWRHEKTASLPPTAVQRASATTAPAVASTIPAVAPAVDLDASGTGMYVLTQPPEWLSVAGVLPTPGAPPRAWLEVWATKDATRTRGTWLAAQLVHDTPHITAAGAARVSLVGDDVGLMRRTRDGVVVLTFSVSPDVLATVSARGVLDDDLFAIAEAMTSTGLRPELHGTLPPGLEPVFADTVAGGDLDEAFVYGNASARVRYEGSAGRWVEVVASAPSAERAVLERFVLASVFDRAEVVGVPGLVDGRAPGLGDDVRIVRWEEDGAEVAILGNLTEIELLGLSRGVQEASSKVWQDEVLAATAPVASRLPPDEAGRGVLANGEGWQLDLSASGDTATLVTDSAFDTFDLVHDDRLHVISTNEMTVVIARVASMAKAAGMVLRVSGSWGDREIGLEPAGAIGTPFVAVYAFSEMAPFVATLLDVDGTPLEIVRSPI